MKFQLPAFYSAPQKLGWVPGVKFIDKFKSYCTRQEKKDEYHHLYMGSKIRPR